MQWLVSSDINQTDGDKSSSNGRKPIDDPGSTEKQLVEEQLYLRARPHLLLDDNGQITHLSTGARPTKHSDYVYTLVVPVIP